MRGSQGTAPRGGPPTKGRTAPIGGGCPGTSAGVVKVEAWWPGAECRPEGRQRPGRQGVWAQNQQNQQAGGGGGCGASPPPSQQHRGLRPRLRNNARLRAKPSVIFLPWRASPSVYKNTAPGSEVGCRCLASGGRPRAPWVSGAGPGAATHDVVSGDQPHLATGQPRPSGESLCGSEPGAGHEAPCLEGSQEQHMK